MRSRLRTRTHVSEGEVLWRRHAKQLRKVLDSQNRRLWRAARDRDLLLYEALQVSELAIRIADGAYCAGAGVDPVRAAGGD